MNEQLSFGYPGALLTLVPLAVLGWWYVQKWRERVDILQQLREEHNRRTTTQRMFGVFGALFCTIVALSFPRFGVQSQYQDIQRTDIIVVLDFSYSMWAQDTAPSRLERAKREIIDLTHVLDGTRIGLIGFAAEAYARMPVTSDYASVRKVLRDSSPIQFRSQGSNLASGIQLALDLCQRSAVQSTNILVISDGEIHEQDLSDVASRARGMGVRIYGLGVGEEEGSPIPLSSGGFLQDSRQQVVMTKRENLSLYQLAEQTEGAFAVSVAGMEDITALYTDGMARLSRGSEHVETQRTMWNELFQWPLLFAALCLLYGFLPRWNWNFKHSIAFSGIFLLPAVHASDPLEGTPLVREQMALELLEQGKAVQAQYLLEGLIEREEDILVRHRLYYNAGIAAYHAGSLQTAIEHWNLVREVDEYREAADHNIEEVRTEIEEREKKKEADNRSQNNPTNESESNNDEKKSAGTGTDNPQASGENDTEQKESINWTQERARRLFHSVQEGSRKGVHRGLGSQEKGW